MNIWHFQTSLTNRLLAWSAFSMVSGAFLAAFRDGLWRGLGLQFFGWGLMDALIAIGGSQVAKKRFAALPDPADPVIAERQTANLRRLLAVNTGLDVLYILGGFWLAQSKGQTSRFARGSGLGIIIQGAFLCAFDLIHALRLFR